MWGGCVCGLFQRDCSGRQALAQQEQVAGAAWRTWHLLPSPCLVVVWLLMVGWWCVNAQFIHQLGVSEHEDQRELAFVLLYELGDTLSKGMEGSLPSLKQFYQVALQDRSRKVRHISTDHMNGASEAIDRL